MKPSHYGFAGTWHLDLASGVPCPEHQMAAVRLDVAPQVGRRRNAAEAHHVVHESACQGPTVRVNGERNGHLSI
jgi:hypothetical protein